MVKNIYNIIFKPIYNIILWLQQNNKASIFYNLLY